MGKRKSSKPPPKKQKPKLEKFFSCPFCNSDKTVSATFDWERQIGTVNCTVCQVSCAGLRWLFQDCMCFMCFLLKLPTTCTGKLLDACAGSFRIACDLCAFC